MAPKEPAEPPPSYEQAATGTGSSSSTAQDLTHLTVPHKTRSGIPPQYRRSMEDESRPLPDGWVRQYDSAQHHQFFVDTNRDPPRSIWHHPYDDDTYMSSLSSAERERIQGLHTVPSDADIAAESSEDDSHHTYPAELPPRPDGKSGHKTFGRKLKDKLTNSTHEERAAQRAQREREEAEAYERHRAIRVAMSRAAETGQPQLVGRDKDGKDVYIEPPIPGNYGPYGGGGYGYNPYGQGGVYSTPNARYIRPDYGYSRPYGYGYGGGLGLPLLGGIGGGLLVGSLLF